MKEENKQYENSIIQKMQEIIDNLPSLQPPQKPKSIKIAKKRITSKNLNQISSRDNLSKSQPKPIAPKESSNETTINGGYDDDEISIPETISANAAPIKPSENTTNIRDKMTEGYTDPETTIYDDSDSSTYTYDSMQKASSYIS